MRTLTADGELKTSVTGDAGLSGTGVAGKVAEWASAFALQASTLVKSGAGVLTLSAAGDYTLTVPATGTAALLAADNAFSGSNTFSGTVNTISPGGLRLGSTISQTPLQGGIIARGSGTLNNHGFWSSYWNTYIAANAYHDGTNWKTLISDSPYGYSSIVCTDIGAAGAALVIQVDGTQRLAGDTRVYTITASFEFGGQLQLPITGSGAGLLMGGDALLYRSAADILRTPDSLTIDAGLNVGSATGATTGMIKASDNLWLTKALDSTTARDYVRIENAGYSNLYIGAKGYEFYFSSAPATLAGLSVNVLNGATTVYGGLNVGSATGATNPGMIYATASYVASAQVYYLSNTATNTAASAIFPSNLQAEFDVTNSAGATYGSEFLGFNLFLKYRGAATINAANLRDVVGITANVFDYNSGTIPYMVGVSADMRLLTGAGTVTNLVQFHARSVIVSAGSVTNKYSFKAESGAGAASIYDGVNVGTATGAGTGFVRVPSGAGGVSFGTDGCTDIYRFNGTTKGTAGNQLRIDAYDGISLGTSQSGGQQTARLTIASADGAITMGNRLYLGGNANSYHDIRRVGIANGSTSNLFNVSGTGTGTLSFVFIVNESSGAAAIFFTRGGINTVDEVSDPSGTFFPSDAGTGTRVFYSGGQYLIRNSTGATVTYSVFVMAA